MSKIYQKTLADQINFEGLGLHSGLNSKIKILPGKVNQGIVFRRVDLKKIILSRRVLKMLNLQDCAQQ